MSEKFYTKIYTNFFPPCEKKLKSSSFARKTCVLGNILWIDQTLRRGLLYPFNYGSISCYPAGNTSSLRSSCHRRRWGEPGTIIPAYTPKHILLSRMGIRRRAWNTLYFTTFRAKRQLFSWGKFESTPMLPRSRFLSKNMIQILDKKTRISIIKIDMILMVCCRNAATGREGI